MTVTRVDTVNSAQRAHGLLATVRTGGSSDLPAVVSADDRRRAARYIANRATSAADCATILDALGLRAQDGLDQAAQ